MDKKLDKKLKIAMIIAIVGIIFIFTGSTYAIFSKTITSDKKQVIKSGSVKLELTEETNGLELSNFTAMSDADGLLQEETYNFSLKNSGDANAKYKIILEDKNTTSIDIKYVKVGLVVNGKEKGPMNLKEVERIIDEGALKQGKTNTYKLRIWLDNSQSENLDSLVDKGISFKIKVSAEQYFDKFKTGADTIIAKVGTDGLVAESHPATEQLQATTDYRYTGANPNNYIKFNNETWRIIGVFDVDDGTEKLEKRIKIIRDENIGKMAWDSNQVNDWTTATGMKLLNEGDYWNRTGSYASNGLTSDAKNQIADAKWYLGGTDQIETVNAIQFYSYERGITVYSGNQISWTGKVGLMYLSDYGYATSGDITTNREACLAKEMYNWDDSLESGCSENDWLLDSSNSQWTLSRSSGDSWSAFYVDSTGAVRNYSHVGYTRASRPSVYLKSDVLITGGNGSSATPYEISK